MSRPAERLAADGPLAAIAGFAEHLREHGLRVGIAEQIAMADSARRLPVTGHRALAACWRALVCGSARDWRRYPELFAEYWFPARARGRLRSSGVTRRRRNLREAVQALHDGQAGPPAEPKTDAPPPAAGTADQPPVQAGDRAQGGASSAEPLARRDFSDWRADEIPALERLAEEVARRLRRRLVRRRQRAAAGSELDVRGTLRASLKYGGVPFQPLWRRRRRELPRVFVLVDVSRSMELHARLFLLAARALHAALDARVFVFHTRLAEVTGLMGRPTGRVQEKINAVTFGFGAGTRIATALHEFHTVHARAALRLRSIVLLFSDGYDTDPPERLRETLAAIAARGARVCWLHPTREPPASLAVQGAATLVDCFAPVYNLESMARLPALLAGRASSNGWPETPPGAVR